MDDIKLSVTRNFIKSPEDKSEQEKILASQNHVCKFCEIDIKEHACFHYEENDNKFIGLCKVCYSSQHLESIPSNKAGKIIMISNVSQLDIIHLSRTIEYIKKLDMDEFSDDIDSATMIRYLLEESENYAERYYGDGSSDVELVAQMLSNQNDEMYERRYEGLYNMRWLPDYNYFKEELDYWFKIEMESEDSIYHPSKWESMAKQIKSKINK